MVRCEENVDKVPEINFD